MPAARPSHNPSLGFTLPGWQGNPLDAGGRYRNLDGPSEKGFGDLLRWQMERNPQKELKKGQRPLITVTHDRNLTASREDGFTWLGHASFLFALGGRQIITDPVFHDVAVVKRQTPLPCAVEDLKGIDIILLSHNHRDHMDRRSLTELCSINPKAVILTGLGIGALLRQWKITNRVIEAGWYQSYPVESDVKVTYLPARHWNRRGLLDLNEMLWGSFLLDDGKRKLYFGADSGLGSHFQAISEVHPGISHAFIGIGAYKPEWFMHPSHTSPEDAIRAFRQLGAANWVTMHHGTFDLSDEPIFYPWQEMERLAQEQSLHQLLRMDIGAKHFL
jgi:L-ascorbate metabolism protein UlaG (beta-lactamase superfamily)